MDAPPTAPAASTFDLVAAIISGGTLATVLTITLLQHLKLNGILYPLQEFITPEDIAAGLAEEREDKAKLAAFSGESTTPSAAAAEPNVPISESTPLLKSSPSASTTSRRHNWQSIVFVLIGALQAVVRIVVLVSVGKDVVHGGLSASALAYPIIFEAAWVYATLDPLFHPKRTAAYAILMVYIATLISALGVFYSILTSGGGAHTLAWSDQLAFQVPSAALVSVGIAIIMGMPLAENGEPTEENGLQPAWEDYTTLFGWLSFVWMSPMVAIGISRAVEESDIWQLSHLMRSRILMAKFRYLKRSTLLRRIVVANALDITVDFLLTLLAAALEVARPFFLNLVLRSLQPEEEVSIQSLPMRNMATAVPQAVYAVPEMIYTATISSYRGLSFTDIYAAASATATSTAVPDDVTARRQLAYFYAGVTFLCSLVKTQVDLQHLYYSRRAAVRAQAELIAAVYEKSLVRKDVTGQVASDQKSKKGKGAKKDEDEDKPVQSADVGKIVSLIATDASTVANGFNMLTRLYEIPVSMIGAAYLLYTLMGWSAFSGYLTFVLVTPINYLLMKQAFNVRKTLLDVRDKRMREMNQAIQAIKFIKYFAWEGRWIERIMAARAREITWLRKSKILNFWISFFWDVIPLIVSLISFCVYVLVMKGELTVAIAFPALQTFDILTRSFTMIPMIAQWLVQLYTSILRIGKYLEEDEVPDRVSWLSESRVSHKKSDGTFDERVGFEDATFRWVDDKKEETKKPEAKKAPLLTLVKQTVLFWKKTPAAPVTTDAPETDEEPPKDFELKDLDFLFQRGKLNLVSGPTGSGKSSLLAALLGEMNLVSGNVYLPKVATHVDPTTGLREDVSFCAQQPWLQHQSIRENILFGQAFQEKRYNDVLKACALITDLALLDDGDQTEIGEKGVSLSGGQKARVALARAVYAHSKTVILDDVLSAVDSHTAEQLIKECVCGPLLADRTVILVTHHVDLVINHCAYVVQLDDGIVAAHGTPEELRSRGLLNAIKEIAKTIEPPAGEVLPDPELATAPALTVNEGGAKADDKQAKKKLVDNEDKAQGRVSLKIYHVYLSASSYWLFSISLVLLFFRGAGEAGQKFWLRFWGEAYEIVNVRVQSLTIAAWPNFPHPRENVLPYLGVFVLLQLLTSIVYIFSQVPSIFSALRGSRRLYRAMLMKVIRAPSRWFDKTPSGRILNRFSKDIDTIDSGLQMYLMYVLEMGIFTTISVVTVMYGAPVFIVPFVIIMGLQWWFSQGYVSVSRDLRRIESNTRSPIIASFSEVINGLTTVRAFGAERFFVNNLFERLDRVQAANYYYWMCNRWLLFRFDSLGAFIVLFATIMSISSGASPGLVGIVVSQAQGIILGFYWLLRMYTELEQSLNSVERVYEYMDVPSEPAPIIEGSRPPAAWPTSSGGVQVENLVLKYSPELEPVLKGISFDIKPAEKIGLVGRTGSGKSTLALAFFRFVDPEEGKIIIDNIDITSIGLQDLRSRLTIIPQDAVLFTGTIRDNLDPFNEYTDEECIDALTRVQLRTSASPATTAANSRASSRPTSPLGGDSPEVLDDSASSTVTSAVDRSNKIVITLDTAVSESGNNFSSGQRQLIAMARALLRRSNVVVMDESTASVDFATDIKIQEAIREEFKESILITIAHRLRTVIDYDRILVLDAGKVAEFDTPANLIAKEDSIFHSMCVKSGDLEELREAAQKKAAWTQ